MIHRKHVLAFLAFLLMAPPVFGKTTTEDQEREARTACLAGDYAKGIAILSELFVATQKPVLIYNQGRCFEQNHRYEDAIARFQEYLRVGQRLSKAEQSDARKHIADCEDLMTKQGGSPSTTGQGVSRESKERTARKACLSGNVDKGAEILSDLYLDGKDPTILYNLARCYEQNHRYEDAVSRFREYLLKAPNLTEADRTDAQTRIATCRAYLGTPDPAPTATSKSPSRPGPAKPANSEVPATDAGIAVSQESATATLADTPPSPTGSHARQPGIFFQFERVLIPGVSYGITEGFEVQAGALIGYYKGAWLGTRYLLFNGAVKPGLGLAMPLFVVDDKAVVGIQGSALVQWDLTRHLGVYASLGLSYFPSATSELRSLWFLPGLGTQVRL